MYIAVCKNANPFLIQLELTSLSNYDGIKKQISKLSEKPIIFKFQIRVFVRDVFSLFF
jgi:hypothetical protein